MLRDKHIIVTGASRGLGLRIAQTLHDLGADLILVAKDRDWLLHVACTKFGDGKQPFAIPANLARTEEAEQVTRFARCHWDHLDGLVNCAGVLGPVGREPMMQEWERTFQINFFAPVTPCQDAVRWMGNDGGSIVNILGGGALSPRPGFAPYAVSKAALARYSENLAAEVSGRGIRVNCVSPGRLPTDMMRDIIGAGPDRAGLEEYQAAKATLEKGADEDPFARPAQLVAHLLSDAWTGVTGRIISAVWDVWETIPDCVEMLPKDAYTMRRTAP